MGKQGHLHFMQSGGHFLFSNEVNVKYLAIVLTTGHCGIIINISQHFEFKMSQA